MAPGADAAGGAAGAGGAVRLEVRSVKWLVLDSGRVPPVAGAELRCGHVVPVPAHYRPLGSWLVDVAEGLLRLGYCPGCGEVQP